MVRIICDKCKKDCGRCGFDISVYVLLDPVPRKVSDIGTPTITHDNTHMRFTLCQECYSDLKFPNIYSIEDKGLKFEENEK